MEIILAIILIIGFVLLMRFFGAWMLRIDEVIKELQEIKKLLNKNDQT